MLILDSLGNPFFYKRLESVGYDWKLQPNGKITYFDGYGRMYFGMDSTFTVVDSFYCKNDYNTNEHDLTILPDGHILLIGEDDYYIDMSRLIQDGQTNVAIMGTVIQELDKHKNVVFQWRSQDHFDVLDATSDIGLSGQLIDFPHTNSVDIDVDSNIIISSRHADEITKIDRETGDIIWR